MVVVAHPGDEAFGFGGAIASAAAQGAYVVVVCATRGHFDPRLRTAPPLPGGKNRDTKDAPILWRNLDTVREDELRRSVALLGVRVLRMLDYAETELPRTDFDRLVSRIVEPIRMHRPEVILTFGPDGVTGDPDHRVISRATSAAFDLAGEPLAYEDDLEEDQVAWRAAKLFHLVAPRAEPAAIGEGTPDTSASPVGDGIFDLELGDAAQLKLAAIARHVSQTGSSGPFAGWDLADRDRHLASEHYRLARSNLPAADAASGFFAGLP
jgi:LmbE family N-acetylglucosaminyl deacetylase